MSFPCIACGLCCRYSGYVSELKILINKENICRNFDEKTNKCRIYTSRPLICNIDEMYKQKYCHQMNKKEFYLANLKICYKLNSSYGNKNNMRRLEKIINNVKMLDEI